MHTSTLTSVVSGLIGLTLAACSGATAEPVDQSAQAEAAHRVTAPADAQALPGAEPRHHGGRGRHDPAELVQRFDKNADGKLQLAELPEHLREFMAKADSNADGALSLDELTAAREKLHAERLAKLDVNHDGSVSPEERKAAFEKFAQKRFAKWDKNSDGALTKDELGDERWGRLSVADADQNGSVTQAEIRTAVASGALKFPHRGRAAHGGRRGAAGEHAPDAAAPPADAPSGS